MHPGHQSACGCAMFSSPFSPSLCPSTSLQPIQSRQEMPAHPSCTTSLLGSGFLSSCRLAAYSWWQPSSSPGDGCFDDPRYGVFFFSVHESVRQTIVVGNDCHVAASNWQGKWHATMYSWRMNNIPLGHSPLLDRHAPGFSRSPLTTG